MWTLASLIGLWIVGQAVLLLPVPSQSVLQAAVLLACAGAVFTLPLLWQAFQSLLDRAALAPSGSRYH